MCRGRICDCSSSDDSFVQKSRKKNPKKTFRLVDSDSSSSDDNGILSSGKKNNKPSIINLIQKNLNNAQPHIHEEQHRSHRHHHHSHSCACSKCHISGLEDKVRTLINEQKNLTRALERLDDPDEIRQVKKAIRHLDREINQMKAPPPLDPGKRDKCEELLEKEKSEKLTRDIIEQLKKEADSEKTLDERIARKMEEQEGGKKKKHGKNKPAYSSSDSDGYSDYHRYKREYKRWQCRRDKDAIDSEKSLKRILAEQELRRIENERANQSTQEKLRNQMQLEQLQAEAASRESSHKLEVFEEKIRNKYEAEKRAAEQQAASVQEQQKLLESKIRTEMKEEQWKKEEAERQAAKDAEELEQRIRQKLIQEKTQKEIEEQEAQAKLERLCKQKQLDDIIANEKEEQMKKDAVAAWTKQQEEKKAEEDKAAAELRQKMKLVLLSQGFSDEQAENMLDNKQPPKPKPQEPPGDVVYYKIHKQYVATPVFAELHIEAFDDPNDPQFWRVKGPLPQSVQDQIFERSKCYKVQGAGSGIWPFKKKDHAYLVRKKKEPSSMYGWL